MGNYKDKLVRISNSKKQILELSEKLSSLKAQVGEDTLSIQKEFNNTFKFSLLKEISNRNSLITTIEVPRGLGTSNVLATLKVSEVLLLSDHIAKNPHSINCLHSKLYRAICSRKLINELRGSHIGFHTIVLDVMVASKFVDRKLINWEAEQKIFHEELSAIVTRCNGGIPLKIILINTV